MLEMEIERYGSVENVLEFNRSDLEKNFEKFSVPIYFRERESTHGFFRG